ncbi:hypothetical protein ZOSMA_42G00540 [Zostera marina]|uniref:Uncharacterized protein n=1 Tax=Zostera marina TaxID=29655 RepID=A0A0K9P201_ZOSMR|nr:hypothetical protein ZOSMA_42G00540 [Zostera marina]
MEVDRPSKRLCRGLENDSFLKWGVQKRLRCMKIKDDTTTNTAAIAVDLNKNNNISHNNNTQKARTAPRVNRGVLSIEKDRLNLSSSPNGVLIIEKDRLNLSSSPNGVLNIEKDRLNLSSSPNGVLREWESWGSESRKSSSQEKEENSKFYFTRGSTSASAVAVASHSAPKGKNIRNGHIGIEAKEGKVRLPRIFLSLSNKEKEEDFMAMKGCKLPQRPKKKRTKLIQKAIMMVTPGTWLSDLSHERYEVREKKIKKRKRGLKGIALEIDSE